MSILWWTGQAQRLVGKDCDAIELALIKAYNGGLAHAREICDEESKGGSGLVRKLAGDISTHCLHCMILGDDMEPIMFPGKLSD